MSGIVEVTPRPHEVALARVPAGMAFRYPLRSGELRYVPVDDEVRWAEVPGSALWFWGVDLMTCGRAHRIGLNRHKADRPVWERAARLLAGDPQAPKVVYVLLVESSPYGRPVWLADSIRAEEGNG